jgi:hypothetical protein
MLERAGSVTDGDVRSNWIFQGNPTRSNVMALIGEGEPIRSWSIARHFGELRAGDNAALWVSGRNAGVYALGAVTGVPYEDVTGEGWAAADRGRLMTFVPLVLDEFLAGNPISKQELAVDPRFRRARILVAPRAGNPFATSDVEWSAIEDRCRERLGPSR